MLNSHLFPVFNIYKCAPWQGEQILLSVCAYTYPGSAIQVIFLLCRIINYIFISKIQALFSHYPLGPSIFQGESDSWHLMTIKTVVAVLTGRKLQAWGLQGSWQAKSTKKAGLPYDSHWPNTVQPVVCILSICILESRWLTLSLKHTSQNRRPR